MPRKDGKEKEGYQGQQQACLSYPGPETKWCSDKKRPTSQDGDHHIPELAFYRRAAAAARQRTDGPSAGDTMGLACLSACLLAMPYHRAESLWLCSCSYSRRPPPSSSLRETGLPFGPSRHAEDNKQRPVNEPLSRKSGVLPSGQTDPAQAVPYFPRPMKDNGHLLPAWPGGVLMSMHAPAWPSCNSMANAPAVVPSWSWHSMPCPSSARPPFHRPTPSGPGTAQCPFSGEMQSLPAGLFLSMPCPPSARHTKLPCNIKQHALNQDVSLLGDQ